GDRVVFFAAIAHSRYWHKADIRRSLPFVRFRAVKRTWLRVTLRELFAPKRTLARPKSRNAAVSCANIGKKLRPRFVCVSPRTSTSVVAQLLDLEGSTG